MTPFKEKLNKELGQDSLFTQELQEEILRKVQQPSKKKRHWQYPLVLVSATAIMLFLIIIGPWSTTNKSKQVTIDEIAKNESVKQFAFAVNWKDKTFEAGRIGWVWGQQEFRQGKETELLLQVLQHAELSEMQEYYSTFRDVWLQFENGQIAKLKMLMKDEELAYIDMKTNNFYKVDSVGTAKFYSLTFEDDGFNSDWLLILLLSLLAVAWIAENIVRKVFDIPKDPKYVSHKHKRTTIIFSVIKGIILLILLIKGWIIFKVVAFAIIGLPFLDIVVDYYYGREEKRHYVTIVRTIVGIISLTLFFFILTKT